MEAKSPIVLTEKQDNAIYYLNDSETIEVLYGGGVGGGKSFFGCLWIIQNSQKYAGTRWLMGRSVLKNLKETTLNTFFDISSLFKLSNQYTYNSQTGIISFYNNSEIILKDLFWYKGKDPNFDGLGSLEITGAFIDECSQITRKAKDIVKSRIRYRLDDYDLMPKMLMTCNPDKGWVYDEFYKPNNEKQLIKTRKFIQSLLSDNPHISKHYKRNLLTLDKASKERLLYGNWEYDDDPTALIHYDNILNLFSNTFVPFGTKRITADVALQGSDKMVVGYWEGYRLTDVVVSLKNDAKVALELIDGLAKKYNVVQSNICYDADGVGAFLTGFLPNSKPFNNGSRAMNDENYENLKTQCYYKMAERINEGQMFVAHHKHKHDIIDELGYVKSRDVDKDGKLKIMRKEQVKERLGRSPDFSDMMAMREYFELKPKYKGLTTF